MIHTREKNKGFLRASLSKTAQIEVSLRVRWRIVFSALCMSLFAGCPDPTPPPFHKASPPPDVTTEKGTVGVATDDALLEGPRQRGQKGDWIVRNDILTAVFRKDNGQLVDLGFRDEQLDILHYMDTVVADTRGTYKVYYHTAKVREFEPSSDENSDENSTKALNGLKLKGLELLGRIRDKDLNLEVRTVVRAPKGKSFLQFDTKVKNIGKLPVHRVGVGDRIYMGNSRLFIPGHGFVRENSKVHSMWIGREGPGFALALVSGEKNPMGMSFEFGSPGFNPTVNAIAKWADLKKGETITARRHLVFREGSLAHATSVIQRLLGGTVSKIRVGVKADEKIEKEKKEKDKKDGSEKKGVEKELNDHRSVLRSDLRLMIHDKGAPDGAPVLYASLNNTKESTDIVLPGRGPYKAALWMSGVGIGPWTTILETGNNTEKNVLAESGNDTRKAAEKDTTGGDQAGGDQAGKHQAGKNKADKHPKHPFDSILLPLPESGLISYTITESQGNPLPSRLCIKGIEGTPDPDFGEGGSPEGVGNMIYSVTGSGQKHLAPGTYEITALHGSEFSISTNTIKIKKGQTSPFVATLERQVFSHGALVADLHLHSDASYDSTLTTKNRLIQLVTEGIQVAVATDHNAVADYGKEADKKPFKNVIKTFPGCEVTTRRSYFGHFNLYPLQADSPVPLFRNASPKEMIRAWRNRKDKPIIQINHPRLSYIGTFNQINLDPSRGKAYGPGFVTDFDAIEVFNGVRIYSEKRVNQNLRDWYMLLNKGLRPTATGGSDSHLAGFHEVGYPKNYLFVGHEDPKKLTEEDFREAIRSRRVVVSTGPFINVTAFSGKKTSETKHLGKSNEEATSHETTVADNSKTSKGFKKHRDTKVITTLIGSTLNGTQRVHIRINSPEWLPLDTLEIIANGREEQKIDISSISATKNGREFFEWNKSLDLSPEADTWYVFVVRSKTKNRYLHRPEGVIMAFTNPIWIDANGDGRFEVTDFQRERPVR